MATELLGRKSLSLDPLECDGDFSPNGRGGSYEGSDGLVTVLIVIECDWRAAYRNMRAGCNDDNLADPQDPEPIFPRGFRKEEAFPGGSRRNSLPPPWKPLPSNFLPVRGWLTRCSLGKSVALRPCPAFCVSRGCPGGLWLMAWHQGVTWALEEGRASHQHA